jgi:hypothetical protein
MINKKGPEAGLANKQNKAAGTNISLEELSTCFNDHANASARQTNARTSLIRRNDPVAGVRKPLAGGGEFKVFEFTFFEKPPSRTRSRVCCYISSIR